VTGTVVLDIDGVILLGGRPLPGAGRALHELSEMGWSLVFATNNATRTPGENSERIGTLTGFRPEPGAMVTSTVASCAMIGDADQPVFCTGEPGMAATLHGAGIEITKLPDHARTVLAGLNRRFTYDLLRDAVKAILAGARFIAANDDPAYPTRRGLEPGAGALVAAMERASGRTAEVAGKPHRPMLEVVSARVGDGPVWVIGDRPETDMALAVAGGWRSVLVLSGVTTDPASVPAPLVPDMVIDGIASLPGALRQRWS